ncbi:serine protease AprX [Paenibacillus rhizosphaerae]|uniref:Serine protease AprX n=1 Tax=Paenibacillus rhizosphaerae TaxID=297318 RepID=A0A839TSC1_9BACL|nr:S8 family serine peptidase [Paenibacillus rhizosphaerae]MBB3129393.1 serine protease AprX [Paenibacillus rhizosphaerae]
MWPSIRSFLDIPDHLTGKNVNIAVIDGIFPRHPDVTSNKRRYTYLVRTSDSQALPELLAADQGPWDRGHHGLMSAAAAAGSGELSEGGYAGAAPEAHLFLLETGPFYTPEHIEEKIGGALLWLKANWRTYCIRGAVLTVSASRDTGLLPWQADPVRRTCEELADEGLLLISACGNTHELISNAPAAAPSVLSVGGVIVPEVGKVEHALPYPNSRGVTFENKWTPEILAPAANIVLPTPFQSREEFLNHFTASSDALPRGYARTEGTSFAAPMILGAAACIWEARPNWSSRQVKSALLATSRASLPIWNELQAGVVDVRAAVNFVHGTEQLQGEGAYACWQRWKSKGLAYRLQALQSGDTDKVMKSLLSFYPDAFSLIELKQPLYKLLQHPAEKVRCVSALLWSEHSEGCTAGFARELLRDPSPHVRMAGMYAIQRHPEWWNEITEELVPLLGDPSLDIRYWAVRLAANINDPLLVRPLIAGLAEEANLQRASTFGERCSALERITGVQFPPIPEWREGQGTYSERSTEARLSMTRRWENWLKASVGQHK